ncbi:MAG: NTP transferase domain-containing protein [Actinobacteria bacterium]|nr:NTP transferase domain-containing protein [Actinomycetota bacterium]MCG2797995.1 NTP transferase domain-containing protein [Cellulomonas sp.]
MIEHDLLVLAGGRARRLGGVSKADVVVAGRALLDRVLDGADAARSVVVVGPADLLRDGITVVQENPPFGGPVAGIEAGFAALGAAGEVPVVLLACDVPRAAHAVPLLLAALVENPAADAAHIVDVEGRAQLLVGACRRAALRSALASAADDVRGMSVRALVGGWRQVAVADPGGLAEDVDTWAAAQQVSRRLVAEEASSRPAD